MDVLSQGEKINLDDHLAELTEIDNLIKKHSEKGSLFIASLIQVALHEPYTGLKTNARLTAEALLKSMREAQ